jgi:hypothetical protein
MDSAALNDAQAAAEREFLAYAALRVGGCSGAARALVKRAAQRYRDALQALQRWGHRGERFWAALTVGGQGWRAACPWPPCPPPPRSHAMQTDIHAASFAGLKACLHAVHA